MTAKPQYFLIQKDSSEPQVWDPGKLDPALPHDCRYFGRVFVEMEKSLALADIRLYVTWNKDQVPEYGKNVVVLFLGDEIGLMPRYARHVRAVIKIFDGTSPEFDIHPWWSLSKLNLLLWIKYFRNRVYSRRSHAEEQKFARQVQPLRSKPLMIDAPIGYALLDDIPMKKMSERPFHCFYAGSTRGHSGSGLRKRFGTPKEISRAEMWQALRDLMQKRPDFKFDGNTTDSSAPISNNRSYSERMMDSKICLAPRGNSVHTWRYFEGIKSGCLVVANRLPKRRHYYEDAPIIEVDRWSQLEKKIVPYLEDETLLEQAQKRTLEYWEKKCSEAAIGSYIARCLNEDQLS